MSKFFIPLLHFIWFVLCVVAALNFGGDGAKVEPGFMFLAGINLGLFIGYVIGAING